MDTTRKTISIYRENEVYEFPEELRERLHAAIMAKCSKAKAWTFIVEFAGGSMGCRDEQTGPGLKPIEFIGFFQGAEAPCSLRKAKTGVFQHPSKAPFTLRSLRT